MLRNVTFENGPFLYQCYLKRVSQHKYFKRFFLYSPAIDNVWKRVAKAVVSGKLGFAAKVNAHDPEDNTHVICVYTEDFTNEEHVRKVEESLRKEGVKGRMTYKPGIYTTLGIYRDNPWRLRPTVYSSHHQLKTRSVFSYTYFKGNPTGLLFKETFENLKMTNMSLFSYLLKHYQRPFMISSKRTTLSKRMYGESI